MLERTNTEQSYPYAAVVILFGAPGELVWESDLDACIKRVRDKTGIGLFSGFIGHKVTDRKIVRSIVDYLVPDAEIGEC